MNTTTVARIHAKAVLPVLLAAHVAEGSVADKPTPAVAVGQFSESDGLRSAAIEKSETLQTRAYREAATEWTSAMTKRFRKLTRKEALGTIAENEMHELEQLTRDRRILEYPRPEHKVLWEISQRQVTAKLLHALKEYVEFHQAPCAARASTR